MKKNSNRLDLWWLSLGFFFIFLGFDGVQQHVTAYYSDLGIVEVGYNSLIILYLSFVLSHPLVAFVVTKVSSKTVMMFGSLAYTAYIYTLSEARVGWLYVVSVLMGFGGALLWNGQNGYLVKMAGIKKLGARAGFFDGWRSLGSALGVFIFGLLLAYLETRKLFMVFAALPLLGWFVLAKLTPRQDVVESSNHFKFLRKTMMSGTALRLSMMLFMFMFVQGLVLGFVPLQIKSILGVRFVGLVTSLFYFVPIMFAYVFGIVSDKVGRQEVVLWAYGVLGLGLGMMYVGIGWFGLIGGVVLMAVAYAIMNPATMAMVGDITDVKTLPYVTSLFWAVRMLGVMAALVLASVVRGKSVYLVSLGLVVISFVSVAPLLKLGMNEVKTRLQRELG